jgi:spore maturation protein CgeB
LSFKYVFLGLSITSSWGNGHATTYRALLRNLAARGHDVTFLERDLPFYSANRDLASPAYATTCLYGSLEELFDRYAAEIREADLVVVGSYVPEGVRVGDWALDLAPGRVAFYDIDTPVTLARLASGDIDYLSRDQIPRYALYLSFTGGPTLDVLEKSYGSPCARALYCSVDPELYSPAGSDPRWDLGYLGTYSPDRQASLERFLLEPARQRTAARFVVAGAQYPTDIAWPSNVAHVMHLPPAEHKGFYNAQRFTLNVTRAPMVRAGWSPSVRLFEAAACATPIISDYWGGLESILVPEREILVARETRDVIRYLRDLGEHERRKIGARARERILAEHTSMHRASALERYTREVFERAARRARIGAPRLREGAGTPTV